MMIFFRHDHLGKEAHLLEGIIIVVIKKSGLSCECGSVFENDRFAYAVKIVKADGGENRPANPSIYHRKAGGDIVNG